LAWLLADLALCPHEHRVDCYADRGRGRLADLMRMAIVERIHFLSGWGVNRKFELQMADDGLSLV
jgi:hypothetical protein